MISRILKVSFLNFSTKVVAALLVLVTQVVITRFYLVKELATYSKLINYINIVTVATGIGLNISALYHLRKKLIPESNIYITALITFFLLSSLFFLLLMAFNVSVYESFLISLFAFLNNLFYLNNARAQAHNNYKRFNMQNLLYALVNVTAIIAIYASDGAISVHAVILFQCMYLAVVNALFAGSDWRTISGSKNAGAQSRSLFGYAGKIFVTNMLGVLLYSGDILLLDLMVSDEQLAVYLLAATAIKFLWLGIDSMGLVIYPEFVQPSDNTSVLKNLHKMFFIVALLLSAALLLFTWFGQSVINLVYGPSFPQLYELVIILVIATYGVMFYKFLSRFFAASEQWMPVYVSVAAGILTNALLIYILVPLYGITGAAYASVGAYVLTGVIIGAWYVSSVKKLKPVAL